MIIWRGWGILAAIFAAVGFFGGIFFGEALGYRGLGAGTSGDIVLGSIVLAAILNWIVGVRFNRPLSEAGIPFYQQHSLFFIPSQYWSIAYIGFAVFLMREWGMI